MHFFLGQAAEIFGDVVDLDGHPFDHILGSPEIEKRTTKGFKGAMETFNVTRPLVAASALGVARAALEETRKLLEENGVEIRMGLPRAKMTYIESSIVDMERMLRSCWLLTIKAVWMSDARKANALESAMSKLYAATAAMQSSAIADWSGFGMGSVLVRAVATAAPPRRPHAGRVTGTGPDAGPPGYAPANP